MRKYYFFGVLLMAWIMVNGIRVHIQDGASVADYNGLVTQATGDMINFRNTWGNDEVFSIARRGTNYTMLRINGQDSVIMGPVSRGEKQLDRTMFEDEPAPRVFTQPVLEAHDNSGNVVGFVGGANGTFEPPYIFIPVEDNGLVEVVDNELYNQGFDEDIRSKVYDLLWKQDYKHFVDEFWDLDPYGTEATDWDGETSSTYSAGGSPYEIHPIYETVHTSSWPIFGGTPIGERRNVNGSSFEMWYPSFFWIDRTATAAGQVWDSASHGQGRSIEELGVLFGRADYNYYYRDLMDAGDQIEYIVDETRHFDWSVLMNGVDYHLGIPKTWAGSYYSSQRLFRVAWMDNKWVFVFFFGSYAEKRGESPICTMGVIRQGDEKPVYTYQWQPPDGNLSDPFPLDNVEWSLPPPDDIGEWKAKPYDQRLFVYRLLDLIPREGAFQENEFEVTPWQQPR